MGPLIAKPKPLVLPSGVPFKKKKPLVSYLTQGWAKIGYHPKSSNKPIIRLPMWKIGHQPKFLKKWLTGVLNKAGISEFCFVSDLTPELVFVNLWRTPGIDSQPDVPVRQPYLSYRPAMLHRQVESNPRNPFLVSLNVYKYGLWSFFRGKIGQKYF